MPSSPRSSRSIPRGPTHRTEGNDTDWRKTQVKTVTRWAPPLVAAAVLALVFSAAHRELPRITSTTSSEVSFALDRTNARRAGAHLSAIWSMWVTTCCPALRRAPVPLRRIAFGSLVTYWISAARLLPAGGRPLRYRFWLPWACWPGGSPKPSASRRSWRCSARPPRPPPPSRSTPRWRRRSTCRPSGCAAGIGLLVAVAAYVVACSGGCRSTARPGLAVGQVTVAALDSVIAGSCSIAFSTPFLSLRLPQSSWSRSS